MGNLLKKACRILFGRETFTCMTKKNSKLTSKLKLSLSVFFLMAIITSCGPNNDDMDIAKDNENIKVSESVSSTEQITKTPDEQSMPLVTQLSPFTEIPDEELLEQATKPFMTPMPEYIPEDITVTEEVTALENEAVIAEEHQSAEPEHEEAPSEAIGSHVYIADSGNGKKYHCSPSCSNMKGTIELTVDEAQAQGYTPCKKCY